MGDVSWTLTLFMKDAPPCENFLEERMERDLICYFEIFDLVKKYGYTTRDNLYCKRDGHGRRKACLVKINNDRDVGNMLLEHEADQKLNFFVEKHSASVTTGVYVAAPNHTGAIDDASEGYDTESSNETDHETDRNELEHESEAMKRRRADPSAHPKKHKRPRNSIFQSEDQEQEEENGRDLDDPREPLENREEDEDILQDSPVHSADEEQDLAKLDTTVSGVSPESRPFKLTWPNGVVQEYRGRFTVSNVMNIKSGGKVIVETDVNGVPNQRSASLLGSFLRGLAKNSSHVPLHIPRWDIKLLRKPKQELITYVETKFVYPKETRHTTEGWMLKIVNKGWRDYKSLLKNKYYKPDKWSLDRIKKRVPSGVNKHQWISLLGTWCQEQHAKTCQRNSDAGKQQRHPHTTGRKSHARLRKEMEIKNKGPVSKIDLWDEAHKKKDGNYANENVQQVMHKARKKLASLGRKKNGELSPEDYDKVFDDVIAKDSTIGGYYEDKYWGDARLHGGSTSAQESTSEVGVHKELQEMKAKVKNVTGFMERMRAFMARNHPDEDWMNEMMPAGNEIKIGDQPEEDLAPMLQDNNISVNIIDRARGRDEVDVVQESMNNVHTTESDPKEAQFANDRTYQDIGNTTVEESTRKESPEQQTSKQHKVNETAESNETAQTSKKNTKNPRAAKAKEHCQNSSLAHEHKFVKASTTKELLKHKTSQKKPKNVVLVSLTSRSKGLVVGKGIIKSRDNKYVVGGDALGDAYWAITVLDVSRLGSERVPRPFGDIQTVEDAIGHCIAWPSTHVKRVKDDSN